MYFITEDKSRTNDNSNYAIVDSLWTFQYCVYFAVDTKSCVLSNAFTRVDGLYQQKHHSNLYEDFIWMKYILIWVYVWTMFRVDDFRLRMHDYYIIVWFIVANYTWFARSSSI